MSAVTLFGIVVMVVLLFDELSNYFSAQWVSSIGVDTRSLDVSKDLYINIDITLPGMTCDRNNKKKSTNKSHNSILFYSILFYSPLF